MTIEQYAVCSGYFSSFIVFLWAMQSNNGNDHSHKIIPKKLKPHVHSTHSLKREKSFSFAIHKVTAIVAERFLMCKHISKSRAFYSDVLVSMKSYTEYVLFEMRIAPSIQFDILHKVLVVQNRGCRLRNVWNLFEGATKSIGSPGK